MISKISQIKQSMFSFFNPLIFKNENNAMSIKTDQIVQAELSNYAISDESYLNQFSKSVLLSMLKELQRKDNQWNAQATREQCVQDTQREDHLKEIDLSALSREELVKALAALMFDENKHEITAYRITA